MDANAITVIVQALVHGATGEINAKVNRCVDDCKELQQKLEKLTSRVDIAEGAELKDKLDKLLDDVKELGLSDARQTEQLITIFRKLNMQEQVKLAEAAQAELKIHVEDGNVQVNQVGKGNLDAGQTGTDN